MEAIQFDPLKKAIHLQSLSKPKIVAEDDLIIEVAYCGICGTDLHIITGEFPLENKKPVVLGHEFSGIVREVGSAVTHVKPGDRVVIDPQSWCTTCKYCTNGKYTLCECGGVTQATGIGLDGGWGKFAKVRARQVYKLPSQLTLRQGVLCEPISCIVWGVERVLTNIPVGSDVLITGAGIIGNLWCSVLHQLGFRKVTVVEPSSERRQINKNLDLGFEVLSPEELSQKLGSEYAFDLAIDCSGNGRAIEQGFNSLRPNGTLCIFGVAPHDTQVNFSPYEIYMRELSIIGVNINRFSMNKAIALMEGMGSRYLDFEKLGIKEFLLKNYSQAISTLKNGSIAKAVLVLNPNLE